MYFMYFCDESINLPNTINIMYFCVLTALSKSIEVLRILVYELIQ